MQNVFLGLLQKHGRRRKYSREKNRVNINFNEILGLNKHPLNFRSLTIEYTQQNLFAFFKEANHPKNRTLCNLFIPKSSGPRTVQPPCRHLQSLLSEWTQD